MTLYFDQVEFLIDLFDEHKKKLYVTMRKNGYRMEQIMQFTTGYSLLVNSCREYCKHILMGECTVFRLPESSKYRMVAFNSNDSLAVSLDDVLDDVLTSDEYSDWELNGIKYAVALAKFYIKYIVFGDDHDVDDIYVEIPDKDDPDSYDWAEHGLDDI